MTPDLPPPDEIAYAKATGCSLEQARNSLSGMSPLLRERMVEAVQKQRSRYRPLHDPLEDNRKYRRRIEEAGEEAQKIVEARGMIGMGSCHAIWAEQARILKERHGITWFPPSVMNPDTLFD